jgi:hypothetical protein
VSLAEDHVREYARSCVRSGLLDDTALYDEVLLAVRNDLDVAEPEVTARARVDEFRAELDRDARAWPEVTDYDRLQLAFAELEGLGLVVLQGCPDHWSAKAELERRREVGDPPAGIAWFTPPDVWHAIDEGMLEVNVWHASTANVAPGDDLLDTVVGVLEHHGLAAHFDEGRIEVSASWQRRPVSDPGPVGPAPTMDS